VSILQGFRARGRSARKHHHINRLHGEGGYTLMEMLVASTIAIVVLGAVVALFVSTQKDAAGVITRAGSIGAAQVGLQTMDKALGAAYAVEYPTAADDAGCLPTAGVQPCNLVDVLARITGTDYLLGFNCSIASATVTTDRSCWEYQCSAAATTPAGTTCTASSGISLLSSRLLIDDVINGTSTSPVFSFCYPNTTAVNTSPCATGTALPTSATVTIDTPSSGTLPTSEQTDPSTIVLSGDVYMANLDFNQ
jgi:Tfp pilus assembly protein PilW